MAKQDLTTLSDEELLAAAKKLKSSVTLNAVLIGFVVGIILFSIFSKGKLGFLSIFLVLLIYQIDKRTKADKKEMEEALKARNLKL